MRLCCLLIALLLLGGCASQPAGPLQGKSSSTKPGGYYLDDGPGDNPPANLDSIPDAVPRREPLIPAANRAYVAMGRTYAPQTEIKPFVQEGIASWYGRRFNGKPTSSGEPYNMYAMTAAHPTLPIPSYARVTSLDTGKSVIVRINDRGPFHNNRIIDLSYTAAYKLGIVGHGRGQVRVESIDPDEMDASASPDQSGIYLQLGAFGAIDNARALLGRAMGTLGMDSSQAHIVFLGGLYRVRLGPLSTPATADQLSERVKQALNLDPVKILQ
jgi:rare lipoprotein A